MDTFFAKLKEEQGALVHDFRRNETIVSQGAKSSCVYRLLSGSIRFDKEIKVGEKSGTTTIGAMNDQSEWNFFGLMSGLGMEEHTTASVVVNSKRATVLIVPSSVVFSVGEIEKALLAGFLRGVAVHLAQILKGVHLRSLGLTDCGVSFPPLQVKDEAAVLAWSASVKKSSGSTNGSLVVSANYVGFYMFKNEEEQVATQQFNVFALKSITKISFVDEKVFFEEGEEVKLVVVIEPQVSLGFVRDTLVTMWSLAKAKKKAIEQVHDNSLGVGVRECKGCLEGVLFLLCSDSRSKKPLPRWVTPHPCFRTDSRAALCSVWE